MSRIYMTHESLTREERPFDGMTDRHYGSLSAMLLLDQEQRLPKKDLNPQHLLYHTVSEMNPGLASRQNRPLSYFSPSVYGNPFLK